MPTDPPPTKRTRRQVNVRLPADLVDRIDARRAEVGISRDAWMERALEYALQRPRTSTTTAPGRRTAARPR